MYDMKRVLYKYGIIIIQMYYNWIIMFNIIDNTVRCWCGGAEKNSSRVRHFI